MAVHVEMTKSDLPEEPRATMFQCAVSDDAHPEYVGMTGYVVMRTPDGRVMGIDCVQLGVVGKAAAKVTPSLLRDLPLSRWDNACRARIAAMVSPAPADQWSEGFEFLQLSAEEQQEIIVRTLVSVRYPEARDDGTPGGRRRLAALERSARTAMEYGLFMKQGRSDPAVAIAEKHSVSHSTARTWIHRARGHGFLPPASTKGNDAVANRSETLQRLQEASTKSMRRATFNEDGIVAVDLSPREAEMHRVASSAPGSGQGGSITWIGESGTFWHQGAGRLWRYENGAWLETDDEPEPMADYGSAMADEERAALEQFQATVAAHNEQRRRTGPSPIPQAPAHMRGSVHDETRPGAHR